MKAKELFFEINNRNSPLTAGQNLRLFEQSLRTVTIPHPPAKQSDNNKKIAQNKDNNIKFNKYLKKHIIMMSHLAQKTCMMMCLFNYYIA